MQLFSKVIFVASWVVPIGVKYQHTHMCQIWSSIICADLAQFRLRKWHLFLLAGRIRTISTMGSCRKGLIFCNWMPTTSEHSKNQYIQRLVQRLCPIKCSLIMNFKIKLVSSFIYKGLNPTRSFLSSTSGKGKILKN